MAKLRTSLDDLPLGNDKIYTNIAKAQGIKEAEVKHVVEFVTRFTAGIINKGAGEAIMLPYFGKFKPNIKKMRAVRYNIENIDSGIDMIQQVMQGKDKIVDRRKPEDQ